MGNRELVEQIKNKFVQFKENGSNTVMVDDVITSLEELKIDISNDNQFYTKLEHDRKMEQYKVENQVQTANIDRLEESQRLTFKSVIEIGQNVLKYALIINGGAGVAMLAFIGNILSKGFFINSFLTWSLTSFSAGVLAAAISSGATYLSQAYYSRSFGNQKIKLVEAMNRGNKDMRSTTEFDGGSDEKYGTWWRNVAIGTTTLAYVLFLAGIILAHKGLYI